MSTDLGVASLGSAVPGEARSYLGLARILSVIWVLLGVLIAVVGLLGILLGLIYLHLSFGGVELVIYGGVTAVVNLFIHQKTPGWEAALGSGTGAPSGEDLLLWSVLGLLFGLVPGIFLLLAYLRLSASTRASPPPPPPSPPPAYGVPSAGTARPPVPAKEAKP